MNNCTRPPPSLASPSLSSLRPRPPSAMTIMRHRPHEVPAEEGRDEAAVPPVDHSQMAPTDPNRRRQPRMPQTTQAMR